MLSTNAFYMQVSYFVHSTVDFKSLVATRPFAPSHMDACPVEVTQQDNNQCDQRVMPGPVFDKMGVDFAGPVKIKSGTVHRPTIIKPCIFCVIDCKL